ncbi:hypothetical protein [Halorientalis litorea]|jgi:hypothetical protein|uniref:hypothetical protein n=1 Tax=Halorientalis litorea TaxID=2931977 RepID=UPI001FF5F15E|nr:hypothetical protein [Halorientalis litorea]
MANDDLLKPLRAINETIANLRQDVQKLTGEAKKIKEAITESAQTIRDAIQENIQAQAELKLMEYVMEVKSVKPQIDAEFEQIKTERSELEGRLESIGERYERKQAELDEKAQERIRDLGSHIFEIEEDQFENGIEDPFTSQVTTAWQALQAHNADVGEERSQAVRDTTSEAVQTMYDFVDRQEQLLDTIEDHRFDSAETPLPTDEYDQLQVPYYVVEYEQDGVVNQQVVVPSQVSNDGTDWCAASLDADAGVESLMGNVTPVSDPATTDTLSEGTVSEALGRYGESSPLGLSYADAATDAMPDSGRVEVQQEVDE